VHYLPLQPRHWMRRCDIAASSRMARARRTVSRSAVGGGGWLAQRAEMPRGSDRLYAGPWPRNLGTRAYVSGATAQHTGGSRRRVVDAVQAVCAAECRSVLDEVPPPPALTSRTWARNFNLNKGFRRLEQHGAYRRSKLRSKVLDRRCRCSVQSGISRSDRKPALTTAESARLGAMYSVVASDSVTACMKAKYHFASGAVYGHSRR